MRLPRITIQRFLVALVFLAIFLWAGRIIVPEFLVHRHRCRERASISELHSSICSRMAGIYQASGRLENAALYRKLAAQFAAEGRKYRRAMLVPWECWALGY